MTSLKAAPPVSSLELTRMRRDVKAKLFGTAQEAVRIGRYRVLRTLGHGGMGIVYLARDEDLGREVAIKLLRPGFGSEGGQRLHAEAKSLARLSHPHVVGVFDVGEYEGSRFIAMEYVQGETLRVWLEQAQRLPRIIEVFLQAGQGLAAAHAVGLVHRDFKPDNVLVGDDGRARVLDFGLARPPDPRAKGGGFGVDIPSIDGDDPLATSLTRAGALLGTPAYMAPEQHLGEPADPRSDQFAFGVALHDALYGHRPFLGEDLRSLSLAIVAGKRQPVSSAGPFGPIPEALVEIVDRALEIDPQRRFASMNEMLEALDQLALTSPQSEVSSAARAAAPAQDPSSSSHSNSRSAAAHAPTLHANADPGLNTQHFESVLGLDQRDGSDRPKLDRAELAALADEVGIDVSSASPAKFGGEVQAATAEFVVREDARAKGDLARRNGRDDNKVLRAEVPVVVHSREMHAGVHRSDAAALSRVLERAYGVPGRHEVIGNSFLWSSEAGEVTLAPHARGATLVLEERLTEAPTIRKRRLRRWGAGGFFFGLLIVNVANLMDGDGEVGLFLMFIYTLFGVGIGALVDRKGRKRALAQGSERLALVADRIGALVSANPAPLDEFDRGQAFRSEQGSS